MLICRTTASVLRRRSWIHDALWRGSSRGCSPLAFFILTKSHFKSLRIAKRHISCTRQRHGLINFEPVVPSDDESTSFDSESDDLSAPGAKRIYILGVGKVAVFLGFKLAGIPDRPPITLIVPSHNERTAWEAAGQSLKVTRYGVTEERQGFDIEFLLRNRIPRWDNAVTDIGGVASGRNTSSMDPSLYYTRESKDSIIRLLIVTVKRHMTIELLTPLVPRLTRDSTICFLQEGMGIVDEVTAQLFPDPSFRPHMIQGLFIHSVFPVSPYHVEHWGQGKLALGLMEPREIGQPTNLAPVDPVPASSRYLMHTLTRTPSLVAYRLTPSQLFQEQLDRMATNAVIQPLSAIFDCVNGRLLSNLNINRIMRLLLAEISVVFRSLPELRNLPNVNMRYDPARMEKRMIAILEDSRHQHSQMLTQVRAGKRTDILGFNGYVFKRAEEMGIHVVTNYMVLQMVMGLVRMSEAHMTGQHPIRGVPRP